VRHTTQEWRTTKQDRDARPAPDLVERNCCIDRPDQLCLADITYPPPGIEFLYLSVVVDTWSRRFGGWLMKTYVKTELVLDALNIALDQRLTTSSSIAPSTRQARSGCAESGRRPAFNRPRR
jgi:putative transposase